MDQDDNLQAFALPDPEGHPGAVAALVLRMPEHADLRDSEVKFDYLMRVAPKEKGGKIELGSVHDVKTMFQGSFKDLGLQLLGEMLGGALPDYLVVIDAAWWSQAGDMEKTALIFHEMAHVRHAVDKFGAPRFDRDGLPVFKIVEHDVTAFNSEVARFGAWSPDLQRFVATIQRHT